MLAELIDLSVGQVRDLTFQDWALASRLENMAGRLAMRYFRRKRSRAVKSQGLAVCPRCLRGDVEPYVRRAWTLGWVAVCPDHQAVLLSGCPSCRRKLTLPGLASHTPFAPERCRGCGFEVLEAEMPAASQHAMRMQAVLWGCKQYGTASFFGMGAVDGSSAMMIVDAILGAFWSNDDARIQRRLLRHIGKDVGLAALRPGEADSHAGLAMAAWFLEDWPERGRMLGQRLDPARIKTFLSHLEDIDRKTRTRLFNLLSQPRHARHVASEPGRAWLSALDPVELGFRAAQEPLQLRRDRLLVIADVVEGKQLAAVVRERRISDCTIKNWLRIGAQHGLEAVLQFRIPKQFTAEQMAELAGWVKQGGADAKRRRKQRSVSEIQAEVAARYGIPVGRRFARHFRQKHRVSLTPAAVCSDRSVIASRPRGAAIQGRQYGPGRPVSPRRCASRNKEKRSVQEATGTSRMSVVRSSRRVDANADPVRVVNGGEPKVTVAMLRLIQAAMEAARHQGRQAVCRTWDLLHHTLLPRYARRRLAATRLQCLGPRPRMDQTFAGLAARTAASVRFSRHVWQPVSQLRAGGRRSGRTIKPLNPRISGRSREIRPSDAAGRLCLFSAESRPGREASCPAASANR